MIYEVKLKIKKYATLNIYTTSEKLKNKWKEVFSKPDPYFNINFRDDVPGMKVNPNKINNNIY